MHKTAKIGRLVLTVMISFLSISVLGGAQLKYANIVSPTSFTGWINNLSLLPAITCEWDLGETDPNSDLWVGWETSHLIAEARRLFISTPSGSLSVSPDTIHGGSEGAGDVFCHVYGDTTGYMAQAYVTNVFGYDISSPSISGDRNPISNAAGWNNSSVTLTFTCNDAVSGIASCGPNQVLSIEGSGQAVTGIALDLAGNTASTTISSINIDLTQPSITPSISPSPNANGWNNTSITVSFSCSDYLSGIATCGPTTLVISSEGAGQWATSDATDNADNANSVTIININIDLTNPTVNILQPVDGATYQQGQLILASYSASDALSGIDSLSGTVPNGSSIDTSTLGGHIFQVQAIDSAGNTTTKTVTYSVIEAPTDDPSLTLFVGGTGTGNGRISGDGINCSIAPGGVVSGICTLIVTEPPVSVSLSATALSGSVFEGWIGCDSVSGAINEICHVTVNLNDRNVSARFTAAQQPQPPEDEGPPDDDPEDTSEQEESEDRDSEDTPIPGKWNEKSDPHCQGRTEISIVLGSENDEDCIYIEPGTTLAVHVGDPETEARRTRGNQNYPVFNVDDNFTFQGQPIQSIELEIEYFDEGHEYFRVQYDAATDAKYGYADPPIKQTRSQEWKTAKFEIHDIFFGNRVFEGDFRIIDSDRGPVTIGKITIRVLQ